MAQKGMDDYRFALSAGVPQSRDVPGDFFHVQDATDDIQIQFDEGKQITRSRGQGGRVYYSRVTVTSATSQAVVLQLGYGYATDSRATVNATITAPVQPASFNVPLPDVEVGNGAQELLAAAETTQLEVLVSVPSDQPNGVRIGDNTTADGLGYLIEPGQGVSVATKEALYAFNPAGSGSVVVTLLSLRST